MTDPVTRITRASRPGATFQVAPPLHTGDVPLDKLADGRMVQSFQPSGLKVAMMDGSVRTIAPGVSEQAFWAAVTPAAGDGPPLD